MITRRISKQNLFFNRISKTVAFTQEVEKTEAILQIRLFYLTHFAVVKSMTQK